MYLLDENIDLFMMCVNSILGKRNIQILQINNLLVFIISIFYIKEVDSVMVQRIDCGIRYLSLNFYLIIFLIVLQLFIVIQKIILKYNGLE